MPPVRPRNFDDSRSETSSTTNPKDKTVLGALGGLSIPKGRRANGGASHNKVLLNGTAPSATAAVAAAALEAKKDPNLPRTDWTSIPTSVLRSYRIAHRLSAPAAFGHPHADLTYRSSDIALRAPFAVLHRRKLRDQKNQRRKLRQATQQQSLPQPPNGTSKAGNKDKDKAKATTASDSSIAQSIELGDPHGLDTNDPSSVTTYLGSRAPASQLANTVRKHFNAQHLSETDAIARFIYVVQQNDKTVNTEGSHGDGTGYWVGFHGREQRKIDGPGGEPGFRLRFRP